jgi:hypothetical protein
VSCPLISPSSPRRTKAQANVLSETAEPCPVSLMLHLPVNREMHGVTPGLPDVTK